MLKRPVRILAALSLASIALSPFAAHAQYTGTNGQIFFDYDVTSGGALIQSVAAVNPDGSESHIIAQGADDGTTTTKYFDATVSAAGTKVAYVKVAQADAGGSEQYSIVLANSDGTSPATLYTAPSPGGGGYIIISNLVFSSDGSALFFVDGNNPSGSTDGIYSIPTTTGPATQLVASSTSVDVGEFGLAVSATRLYYGTLDTTTSDYSIESAHTDGSNTALLHSFGSSGTSQVNVTDVTPDGSKVLYIQRDGSGEDQLFTVDTATGNTLTTLTSLTNSDYMDRASYSPDATKLVYSTITYGATETDYNGGNVVNADGTGSTTVVRADMDSSFWSATAVATTGTYPTPLVLGITTGGASQQGGGSGNPALPDAGKPATNLPIVLGLVGLLAAGGIETARRVRRRA